MALKGLYKANIPLWALCAIEYGDISNLSDRDVETLRDWQDDLNAEYSDLLFSYIHETQGFCSLPEFGLPCECIDCVIYGRKSR